MTTRQGGDTRPTLCSKKNAPFLWCCSVALWPHEPFKGLDKMNLAAGGGKGIQSSVNHGRAVLATQPFGPSQPAAARRTRWFGSSLAYFGAQEPLFEGSGVSSCRRRLATQPAPRRRRVGPLLPRHRRRTGLICRPLIPKDQVRGNQEPGPAQSSMAVDGDAATVVHNPCNHLDRWKKRGPGSSWAHAVGVLCATGVTRRPP